MSRIRLPSFYQTAKPCVNAGEPLIARFKSSAATQLRRPTVSSDIFLGGELDIVGLLAPYPRSFYPVNPGAMALFDTHRLSEKIQSMEWRFMGRPRSLGRFWVLAVVVAVTLVGLLYASFFPVIPNFGTSFTFDQVNHRTALENTLDLNDRPQIATVSMSFGNVPPIYERALGDTCSPCSAI